MGGARAHPPASAYLERGGSWDPSIADTATARAQTLRKALRDGVFDTPDPDPTELFERTFTSRHRGWSPSVQSCPPSWSGADRGDHDQAGLTVAIMTMVEAINGALRDAMAADDRVLVFGEDVGRQGGVFRVTDGLQTGVRSPALLRHAAGRVRHRRRRRGNGVARPARPCQRSSSTGSRYPTFDQMVSHLAKYRLRTRGLAQHAGDDPCALVRRGGCRRAPLGVHRDLLGAQRRPPCGGALDAG